MMMVNFSQGGGKKLEVNQQKYLGLTGFSAPNRTEAYSTMQSIRQSGERAQELSYTMKGGRLQHQVDNSASKKSRMLQLKSVTQNVAGGKNDMVVQGVQD